MQHENDLDIFIVNSEIDDEEIEQHKLDFIKTCQKSDLDEDDFNYLGQLYTTSLHNAEGALKGEAFSKFAYTAIEKAMELKSPKAIKRALTLTEAIIKADEYNAMSFGLSKTTPSLLQKYRADVDDLLYLSFKEPKSTGLISIDYKLYPQGDIRQVAFTIINSHQHNKDTPPRTSDALDSPLRQELTEFQQTPNAAQLDYIIKSINPKYTDMEDEWRIQQMTPEKLSDKNSASQFLITTGKGDEPTISGRSYQTDLSKYEGNDAASLAMRCNQYSLKALELGMEPEEAIKQTSETLILGLHRVFLKQDNNYRELQDNLLEKIGKLRDSISNILSQTMGSTAQQSQIAAPEPQIPSQPKIVQAQPLPALLKQNNQESISDRTQTLNNQTPNSTPLIAQVALGAAAVGAVIMGAKATYNYFFKNYGEKAKLETISMAEKLSANIPTAELFQEDIFNPLAAYTNTITNKLNKLYDQGKTSTQEYKILREEVDLAIRNRDEAYELGERLEKLRENTKNLSKKNLTEKYVNSLIKEYHDLEEIADKVLYNLSIGKMKASDLSNSKSPKKSPSKHSKRVEQERFMNQREGYLKR